MPRTTILAVNQTASPIFLDRLGITVPASGTLNLTDNVFEDEIWTDDVLHTSVENGDIILSLGSAEQLTRGQSLRLFSRVTEGPVVQPVRTLADSNTTLSGTQTIDGVALAEGDRVLLTNQTNPSENGVWLVQSGAWVRPEDYETLLSTDVVIPVSTESSSYGGQLWVGDGSDTYTQSSSQDEQQREIVALKLLWKTAVATQYTEYTYNGDGDLSQVDIWVSASKTTKLFTRVLTYNGDQDLTQVVTTDEVSGSILTTTFTYDGNQDLESRTEVLT